MATKAKTPSTAVAIKAASNIVSIQEQLKAQAAAVADKTAPATGNYIRVSQDKQFLLPDGTKTSGPLELVIVDFSSRNNFFEGAYDPKNVTPPACFAIGTNPLKLVPSKNAPVPQASDCQSCPMNQFGSDGDGKACKNSRLMAVLPPDADEETPLWLLQTSPTANKGFDGYVTSVARVFQTSPIGVVTTVSFDDSVTYAKLLFSDPKPNDNIASHFGRQDEAKEMLAKEPDVSKYEAPAKAPARSKAAIRR
jgi:hypothetical protein